MVEIRVAVGDATQALGLMRRLGELFGRSAISFDRPRKEVKVTSDWESRAVAQVIDAVETWIEEEGGPQAVLWVGDRSYTLPASPSLAASR
jgi:hypothetical protein